MTSKVDLQTLREIMGAFAAATGLLPPGPQPRRYLWTDAFAVANFLELYHRTGEEEYRATWPCGWWPRSIWCWAAIGRTMSLDLSRPLVPGMGQHDALDGWLAYLALQSGPGTPDLGREIGELVALCRHGQWGNDDPLGLGGLLDDAWQTGQLIAGGVAGLDQLLPTLLAEVAPGLAAYARNPDLRRPAAHRLAFRELGLSIGLQAAARLARLVGREPARFAAAGRLRERLAEVLEHQALGEAIGRFWCDPANQAAGSWQEHREINRVMLATSLAPGAFLGEWVSKD